MGLETSLEMPTGIYKRTYILTNENRKNMSDGAKRGWKNTVPVLIAVKSYGMNVND